MNIIEAINDPNLFRPWFKLDSWQAWKVFLSALFGLSMNNEQLEIFEKHTERSKSPTEPAKEAWLCVGRRGGKSLITSLCAVFLACFFDYSNYLAPGERGTVMLIAVDRRQARTLKNYISAFLNQIPLLQPLIVKEQTEMIELSNSINIEIHSANFRAVRGYTCVAACLDEIAFFRSDQSANPDFAILDAIRPAMSTVPSAMLLCLSSPYAKRGALYQAYKKYFGKDGDVLVWQGSSLDMNPNISKRVIDRAYERDPVSAKSEYGAEFRSDLESFISTEIMEGCVVPSRFELPPLSNIQYSAFVDPSGGSKDSMTLSVGHTEKKLKILDCVREIKPPFSPDQVVYDFSQLLKRYHVRRVIGDRYGGEWPRERFRTHGINYIVARKPKSELYKEFLPLLNSGTVELLDNKIMIRQFASLERRTARSGRDSIDHPPGGHDDVANAVAGVFVAPERLKLAGTW